MFFLLRMAFWLALVLALLPQERRPKQPPKAGVPDAAHARRRAACSTGRLCAREEVPWKAVGPPPHDDDNHKARDTIDPSVAGQRSGTRPGTDTKAPDHAGAKSSRERGPAPLQAPSQDTLQDTLQNTLTADDLAVARRGLP